jgi:hypothetical protein
MLSVCQAVYNCIVDECADGMSRTRQYPSQTQVSRKRIWMPDMAGGRGMERSEGCVSQDDGDSRTPVETVGVLLCIVRARGCSTVTPLELPQPNRYKPNLPLDRRHPAFPLLYPSQIFQLHCSPFSAHFTRSSRSAERLDPSDCPSL